MRDDEHQAMTDIGVKLDDLKARSVELGKNQKQILEGAAADAANVQRQHEGAGLLHEMAVLETERDRLRSMLQGDQAVEPGLLTDLAERVERLRRDYSA